MNEKSGNHSKTPEAFPWRTYSWICSILAGLCIWALFYFKISRLGPENPYHPFDPAETAAFGVVFGGLGAAALKFLIIDSVLSKIAKKRPAAEIAEEVLKDVAKAAVGVAAGGVLDEVAGSSEADAAEGEEDGD